MAVASNDVPRAFFAERSWKRAYIGQGDHRLEVWVAEDVGDLPAAYTLDGVGGVPRAIALRLIAAGEARRAADHGRVRACFEWSFVPPVGRQWVVVSEKSILHALRAESPFNVQSLPLNHPDRAALLQRVGL